MMKYLQQTVSHKDQDVRDLKNMLEDINKRLENMKLEARANAGLPSGEGEDEGREKGEKEGMVSGDEDVVNGRSVLSLRSLILLSVISILFQYHI